VLNVVINMFPPVFRLQPDYSVRLNNELKAQPLGNRIWLTGQPQYQDHFGQYGKGDTAAATKLLEDAGYAKGADGIYAKDGRRLSLRISTTAGNQLRETQGQLFQAQMKDIGVGIKIANVDATKHFGEWLPNGNFDIANFAWVGNPFAISSSQDTFRTGGGSNYGQDASTKVDQLFAQAVRESRRPGRPSSATRSTSS
jgi:peptide/nickel transport system substrate-binding protein